MMEQQELDKIIDKYDADPVEIMNMLLDIQEKEDYLPQSALRYLAEKLNISLSGLYQMATFYEALSLKPLGRNRIHVCTGTACHVRGAAGILNKLEQKLSIKPGDVTPDLNFGLKTVNCLGACALAPVVVVNGKYYGHMSALKTEQMLQRLAEK